MMTALSNDLPTVQYAVMDQRADVHAAKNVWLCLRVSAVSDI